MSQAINKFEYKSFYNYNVELFSIETKFLFSHMKMVSTFTRLFIYDLLKMDSYRIENTMKVWYKEHEL